MDDNRYPLTNFRFLISIDNIAVAGFSEVSGLEKNIETEDYKEGGNDFIYKFPKGISFNNLVLKKGLSDNDELWQWYQKISSAISHQKPLGVLKKNITLVVLDEKREKTKWTFIFKNAYPVKWTGPTFNALGNSIVIETLELVHQGFERSK